MKHENNMYFLGPHMKLLERPFIPLGPPATVFRPLCNEILASFTENRISAPGLCEVRQRNSNGLHETR